IDVDAAGWGWHVDPTSPVGAASIDLLSVLAHELGHVLGLDHDDGALMAEVIQPGRRELPVLEIHSPPSATAATTGVVATVRAADPLPPLVGDVDLLAMRRLLDTPRAPAATAVAVDAVVARSVLERATDAVTAVAPGPGDGATPVPATVWWLVIGLGFALGALRRCRRLLTLRQ
ncbi:MAG TPA: matrixin family metalloprotease, partial [Ilumatobacter sp.]